jgi:quercetin dioxygenase-like cupin family protein
MAEQPLIDGRNEKILSLAAETRFVPNGIASRTLLCTESVRAVLFGFDAGQELTEHTSTQNVLVQILSGECEFLLAGKPHRLNAGQVLFLPANLPHSVKATQAFSMLLTMSRAESPLPTTFSKTLSARI